MSRRVWLARDTEMRRGPWSQSLRPFPFPFRGSRLRVVAGVEERAVSPVEAELAGRGAGKEESGAVRVPSSDGSPVRKHRQLRGRASVAACWWTAAFAGGGSPVYPAVCWAGGQQWRPYLGLHFLGVLGRFPFFIHRIDTVLTHPVVGLI